jgi:beta-1,4-mannosyltransferase
MMRNGVQRVAIVVLGDLGRSPRMLYHARALAAAGVDVDLVGHSGAPLQEDLQRNPRVKCHYIPAPSSAPRGTLFLVRSAWRVVREGAALTWLLVARLERPDIVLVQTPPAIPTLLLAWLAARLRAARLIVDWHNLGYCMLALRLGAQHWAVRLSRRHEGRMARLAAAHLCVSRAMQRRLLEDWNVESTVLYDEPAEQFTPTPNHMRADFLKRILQPLAVVPLAWSDTQHPAVIVTSTSWTADEDFDLLLAAAVRAERMLTSNAPDTGSIPDLFVVITGDGPLREAFERRARSLALKRVHLHTVWLASDDYARLLGCADIGVCMHRSASGVDLPMKIADMFGAGLPVCALDYGPCLSERIDHGRNGLLFATADELAAQWMELLRGFPQHSPLLERLRRGVEASSSRRWCENWRQSAAPRFFGDCARAHASVGASRP